MPSGNSNTGRSTPKTPGSIINAEVSVGIPIPKGTGDAVRTAPQPIAHTATSIGITEVPDFGACGIAAAPDGISATKGSFTSSTIIGTRVAAGTITECRPTSPPIIISRENGTRNFAEAVSQRQYR